MGPEGVFIVHNENRLHLHASPSSACGRVPFKVDSYGLLEESRLRLSATTSSTLTNALGCADAVIKVALRTAITSIGEFGDELEKRPSQVRRQPLNLS